MPEMSWREHAKRVFPRPLIRKLRSSVVDPDRLQAAFGKWKIDGIDFQSGLGNSSDLLYGLVRALHPSVCVEIGSARGKSACCIGLALKENRHGKLYAVDPHAPTEWNDDNSVDTFKTMRRNLHAAGVANYVEIVRKFSQDFAASWTREIDMLFIDGDHSYEGVKRDWDMLHPKVSRFGVVIFHDTIWDLTPPEEWNRAEMGVPRFVDQLRKDGFPVITLDRDYGTSLVQPHRNGVPLTLAA
jgi:predicted O-methyltransferase YrrM